MKRIITHIKPYFATLAILFAISGCQKLDEKPLSSISPENFYTTIPQCESALTGAMARLYSEWNDQSYGYAIPIFKRDDDFMGDNGNVPSDYGKSFWGSHWAAILNCNAVVKAINKGTVQGATAADLELLAAQAKFIRAWNYFDIVRLWGGVPIYNEMNEDPAINPLPRATIADTYKQIISDFTYAAQKLPVSWGEDKKGRPTSMAAHGLMAKVYLTMATNPLNATENYVKARDEAKIVMNDGIHGLLPNVADVFKRENKYSKEMIWSLIANSADPSSSPQIWDTNNGWGDGSLEPRLDSIWPSQPRKKAYLVTVNADGQNYLQWSGSQAPYSLKFCGANVTKAEYDSYKSYANLPVIRYADVLLIYAEASNMAAAGANPPQDAVDALNQIIDRANGGAGIVNKDPRASRASISWTKEQFDKRVIVERHFELLVEYNRWFDLIRKKMLSDPEVFPKYWGYKAKDSDYLWPIPKLDIDNNPLLTQNPGYN